MYYDLASSLYFASCSCRIVVVVMTVCDVFCRNKKAILKLLTTMVDVASVPLKDELRVWGKPVLGIWKPSVLHVRTPPVSTRDYLKERKWSPSTPSFFLEGQT